MSITFPLEINLKKRGNPQKSDKQRISLMLGMNKLCKIFLPPNAFYSALFVIVLPKNE